MTDSVTGGLIASDSEQQHEEVEFVFGQNIAIMFADQGRDDVVFRFKLALCRNFVGLHVQLGGRNLGVFWRTSKIGVGGADHGV